MMRDDMLGRVVDGSSITALTLYMVDKLPYWASIVAAVWVFLRVYDYIRYVRPKLIQDAKHALKSDPTDI